MAVKSDIEQRDIRRLKTAEMKFMRRIEERSLLQDKKMKIF